MVEIDTALIRTMAELSSYGTDFLVVIQCTIIPSLVTVVIGTFQAEEENVVYGLTHPLNTWDPLWAQACHFKHIWTVFWQLPGIKNKLSVLFMGPGWSPGKPRFGEITDIPDVKYPHPKYDTSLPLWARMYVFIHFCITVFFYSHLALQQKVSVV
jgi:alkylglycerol monooxygenase